METDLIESLNYSENSD